MSLWSIYGDWREYQDLVTEALEGMSADELGLTVPSADPMSSTGWPIWAIAAHTAGARVYWLCTVAGLPGADTTPFHDPAAGWEDDLDHPRSAAELVTAWTSTWAIVAQALDAWTPAALDEPVARGSGHRVRHFTRRSILLRLLTHEAYHAGEIVVIQGVHGLPQIDLWPPNRHSIEAGAGDDR